MVWEMIQYFKKNQYDVLDLGGASNYFKLSFGGNRAPIYDYRAILSFSAKMLYDLRPVFYRLPSFLLKRLFGAKVKEKEENLIIW
jgi:hypothetical protein